MKLSKLILPMTLCAALTTVAWPAQGQQPDEAMQFVELMSEYMDLADKVVSTAETPEGAVFMAIEGIFEVYEQRRDAPGAVRHLNRILEANPDNQTVRNLVRFKLRDIHKETGDLDKALEQLDLVIKENT
ncbi:MAG: hypothetical protein QNJ40_12700 [Xanthomonadales bacterium]|nr:hypothetical protein [Xanthomonadales bacterium]